MFVPRSIAVLTLAVVALVPTTAYCGSNSLLAITPDGRRLLAANADNGTVSVVDAADRKVVREIAVGRRPESVAVIGAGPRAVVTLYKDDQIAVIDFEAGKVVAKIDTPDEPYGVVVNAAGTRALVTNEYPGVVSEVDLESNKVVRQIPAGAFVRGVALDAAEKQIYVTEYYSGVLHAIDLASGQTVDSWRGSVSDNLARHVVLHPTRPKAYVSHIRSRVQTAHGEGSIFPFVSVADTTAGEGKRRKPIAMDTYNGFAAVANPWEAAVSPDGKRIYTVYAGTNDMHVSNLLDDNYREMERVGGLVQLGNNPRSVAVSPDSKTVYVYNTLDFEVQVFDAARLQTTGKIKVCEPPYSSEHQRGKILFYSALQPMVGRRWISCASCHPDGGHDGRTWQNPEGLRNTTGFLAMAETYPIHWSADRDEAQDFEITVRSPLMQGRGLVSGPVYDGLKQPNAGRSADLDAMAEYCNSFAVDTLSPHAAGPGKLTASAERGRQLFVRDDVGCAKCHSGPAFTDSNLRAGSLEGKPYRLHDVGTGGDDPSEKMGPSFDTPTLLGIYRSAPYLHHGKAATLREVLVEQNRKDQHGRTSHLKPNEVDDLVEFLRSLPYELPQQQGGR